MARSVQTGRQVHGGLAVLLALVSLGVAGSGQTLADQHSRRLVHLFNFEERDQGNFEPLPMHWYVMSRTAGIGDPQFLRVPLHAELLNRAGFRSHADVRFDTTHRVSGEHSFQLAVNGGSAGAFLEVGAVNAVPGSDYLISALVRTDRLAHAHARMTAYLIDTRGRRIDASVNHSPPIRTHGQWQRVEVRLLGDHPDAAYIGLELELSQPRFDQDDPLGRHQVVYQEVRGAAWFDDIGIWQLPHVQARTDGPLGIHRSPQPPRLDMQVRDLTGQALEAQVDLYDHTLRRVATNRYSIDQGGVPTWQWRPPLTEHGWYLVDMTVRDRAKAQAGTLAAPVARSLSAFLWLPHEPTFHPADAERFVLVADRLPDEQLELLPDLLRRLGLHATVISAWDEQTTAMNIDDRQARLDALLQQLATDRRHVMLSLHPVPAALARSLDIGTDEPLAMFAAPRSEWMPYLAPVLIRHGQRVRLWMLGSADRPLAFFDADLSQHLAEAANIFRELSPRPNLLLPWSIHQQRDPHLAKNLTVSLDVSPAVRPASLADHLEEWHSDSLAGNDLILHLRTLPADRMVHDRRLQDIVLQMIHAWELDAQALAISKPWTPAADRHTRLVPDPVLGAFSSVAHRLAGRRAVGRLPLGPGLQCVIFDGPAGGMLAMWNESAPPGQDAIDLFLGPEPVRVDLWGNRTPLPLVDHHHTLTLGTMPVFIEGIDPALALFRATFRIEPAFIESTQTRHERVIHLTNPWNRTISGSLHVSDPENWQISPRRQHFSIAAGESATFPLQIAFPVTETAGHKRIVTRFDFVAEQRYVVDMAAPIELGLPDIDFDANVALVLNPQTGRKDAVVTQLITNTGQSTRALYAFANLVGFPRQERIIAELKPGQSIVRRFTFPDAAQAIRQSPVRAGLRETNGPAMLNKILSADE